MADAHILAVLKQLAPYAQSEATLAICARQEVEKLTQNLKLIQAVVADADEKQVKNNTVRLWLEDLKQVLYDADDVLDEWHTRDAIYQLQNDVDVTSGNLKKVFSCFHSLCLLFKNVIFRYDTGRKIKYINKRLDMITKQRIEFGLKIIEVHQTYDESRRLMSSVVDASKIHGREEAKEKIISRLLGESSSQGTSLRVISIVGVGGLGKTTLAGFIFNDKEVVEVFKTKMWVCVSNPFNRVRVAKAIIKEAGGDVPDSTEWQEVHKCLCESVKEKKFLLILDDVWTEDPSHWSVLKLALDRGAPGSRIIVTTRNKNVVRKMGSVDHDIHDLEKLSDEDSWLMIKDIALFDRKNDLEMFEKIGKEIAIKCKGVPLAITILASVLCARRTKEDWKDVLASDIWEMQEIQDFFIPSLLLSYYSLDPITKQCFLCCAVFPKDYEMSKVLLIRLWMAQGFFGYEGNDLEKIGEDHFRILVNRSFFQDFEKDSSGNITHCKMHDLVHDFAMYLSQNESCFLQDGDMIPESDKLRHLFAIEVEITSILKAKSLRTLILRRKSLVPIDLFDKLMCLRTLDLSYCSLEVLPAEVENLVHLRYLDLSGTKLLELPETVCNLYNLQFLGLEDCQSLCKLPEKIGKLSNLRHLEIKGTIALSYFPESFAALSSLRSLCKFFVSVGDHGCKIGGLQLLNNLRGVLELKGLSKVRDVNDAIRAELKMKKHLRELTFDFNEEESGVKMKNVLEKLEPHEDLEILEICDYSDRQFPSWVQSHSSLANVVKISLFRCRECIELPAFGKLAYLKTLEIKSMGSVISIGEEFYGVGVEMIAFPKLECLVIEDMEKLEEWEVPISKDRKIMPLLRYMELKKFLMLRALPCLGISESLEELSVEEFSSVKCIGVEFYGFNGDSSLGVEMTSFPKLESLLIDGMKKLEEWEVPISKDRKIMPLLSRLQLSACPKLRELPRGVWRMEALEELELWGLDLVKRVGVEFVGDKEVSLQDGVTFPKLKKLDIFDMDELEEWGVPLITPSLENLTLYDFPKLKRLPTFKGCVETLESLVILEMLSWEGQEKIVINEKEGNSSGGDSCALHSLSIGNCSKLRVVPHHLFSPSLEELELFGDVGALYDDEDSFPALCSLTDLTLGGLPYSSLPKGFHQLKALQRLGFYGCETLDFDLKELGELTMLQHLEITDCPLLEERFKGDEWRTILAHLPTIEINNEEITNKS